MANTVIALKKSATPTAAPTSLANGELAINYADGKLYYKNATGSIVSISSGTNSFGTVNANNTLIMADIPGSIVSLLPGNNISIVGDAINDRVTIRLSDNVVIPPSGTLKVSAAGGDEGGEIKLANAITNSVVSGDVIIDVWQNHVRFFESGGTNRGAFINLAQASASVGSDLLALAGGTTDTTARNAAGAAFDKANVANITADRAWNHANAAFATVNSAFGVANTALPNTSGVSFNGSLNFPSGNVTLSSGRLFVTSTGPLTPFGAYGAGGSFTWDFNGTSESYLDANTIYFRSGNPSSTERMRIDSSGNVIIRGSDATVQLGLGTWDSDAYIGTVSGDAMFFRTNGVNRMRIGSTGGTTFYGSNEILVDATSANFTMTSSGGTGRSWMMISSTGGTLSFYDSTGSNTRMLLSSSGGTYLQSANGITTHEFDYDNLGARLTLRDDTGTGATRLEEHIDATRLLQLIDGSDMYIGFGSATVATGNLMFMRPGYNEGMRMDATGNLLIGRTNSTVGQRVKLDINGAVNASAILVNGAPFTSGSVVNVATDIVDATRYITFANGTTGTQATSNVSTGLKFNPSSNTLTIDGALFAVTKSFVIDHPTKQNMKLRYGSLEGPENGIYVRGRLDGQSVIELPDYWWNLVDVDSITVNLTPYGRAQELWVQSVSAYAINLNQPAECFFTVFAERKDVDKLVVEY